MKIRTLITTTTLGLFFVLAIGIQAQTPTRVVVNVPFDFFVGKAKMKAGSYTIKRTSERVLALSSADGKSSAIANAPVRLEATNEDAVERLVFNQYGEDYFLSQVWLRRDVGQQLIVSSDETKIAREFKLPPLDGPKRVAVALAR